MPSFNHKRVVKDLALKVAQDPKLLSQLEDSFIPAERDIFVASLYKLLPEEHRKDVKDVYSALSTHCSEHHDEIPLALHVAFKKKHGKKKTFLHRRHHFTVTVGLHPTARHHTTDPIPTVTLKAKKHPYPPWGFDIYETHEAKKIWKAYQDSTLYPDRRGGRTWKKLHKLDPRSLQHVVEKDQSAIIRDEKTNELIGMVIRNFSGGNLDLLEWINGIIEDNTGARRSVRLEDPGKLSQIGYTSGSRSSPQLGWARNLLRKETNDTISRLMYESSSVFALFWNILRNQLPDEIMDDFQAWLENNRMVRMDAGGAQDVQHGEYTVKYKDDEFVFHGVELPPPSGVFGTNYSRFIHREGSAHKYAIAWTTIRDLSLRPEDGGNFFMCSHGVKVMAATDTVVVWKPRACHGTSLLHREPGDPMIVQAGLAIVTPPGVSRLWAEVLEEQTTLEEARRQVLKLESDEVD